MKIIPSLFECVIKTNRWALNPRTTRRLPDPHAKSALSRRQNPAARFELAIPIVSTGDMRLSMREFSFSILLTLFQGVKFVFPDFQGSPITPSIKRVTDNDSVRIPVA